MQIAKTEDKRKNLLELLDGLESGLYEQTTGRLRSDDDDRYCIGGVMCDLSGLGGWHLTRRGWEYRLDRDGSMYVGNIPLVVAHHYGMPVRFGRILTMMNDEGKAFRELSEYIREQM